MRFKATTENLTIGLAADEIAECVSRVVRLLVPHYTRKVYLLVEPELPLRFAETGMVLVGPKGLPSNFLTSFRMILRSDELVVVSGQLGFTRKQWRDFAAKLMSL
jgi:hypothetical protein